MVKLYVKLEPGGMPHCVTPTGPSISLVPFWNKPWKWMLVLWFPSCDALASLTGLGRGCYLTWLCTLAMTWSPFVKLSKGSGHCPFIPMTGRSAIPSGLARTQVMFQSRVTVAALVTAAKAGRHARRYCDNRAMPMQYCKSYNQDIYSIASTVVTILPSSVVVVVGDM